MARCRGCRLIFISPRPVKEQEEEYYRSGYYEAEIKQSEYLSRLAIFEHSLAEIRRFKTGGALLDIGCGPGHFLKKAGELGWKTFGVEISAKAAREASETTSAQIFQGSLTKASYPPGSFDVATFYNVLDQLISPRGALDAVRTILKPGGLVVVRVPNSNFHHPFKTWMDWVGSSLLFAPPLSLTPFHLYQFSPVTLTRLVEKCGFSVVEIRNAKVTAGDPGKTYGPRKEFLLSVFKNILQAGAYVLYRLSGKKVILGPSFELYAMKPSW
jgi:SAM-dependent methyltransferase